MSASIGAPVERIVDAGAAPAEARPTVAAGWSLGRGWLPWTGLAAAAALWWLGTVLLQARTPIAAAFGPGPAVRAMVQLFAHGALWPHIAHSLARVGLGLALAVAIGVPLGIWVGMSRRFAQATAPLLQFLRMVSPLSWMPLAVMVLGVGDAPVVFLLAFAGVWPVVLNTASGVAQLDPNWLLLARSLSATRRERILHVVLPGIAAHVLTGVRLAIGLAWIVLVPAEMLGVSAGLGYFILDTRDRLAYPELMAAIVLIGAIGFVLDAAAQRLHAAWVGR